MRYYIGEFREFPMPALRMDAYYGAFMVQARTELETARYAFDNKTGTEYESGSWVGRYSNPSDYCAADYATREAIFSVFETAIKSRAARLANIANMGNGR